MKISSQVMRFFLLLLFISLVALGYWILYQKPVAGIDDADIYFTYVKNFVNGFGFVYYPGGERVEGFTSLLWVLLVSGFYVIDAKNFPQIILIFNVIAITYALFLCCNFIRTLTRNKSFISPAEILFLLLLTIIPGYIDWTILTLMETGLWSVLLIMISQRILNYDAQSRKDDLILGGLLAVLVTARPESLLWCFVFIGLMIVRTYLVSGSWKVALQKIAVPMLLVAGSISALMLFRLQYFGYPLPNTYYAKVSSDTLYNLEQGFRYYSLSAIQSPGLILITFAAIVSWLFSAVTVGKGLYVNTNTARAQWVQFALSTIVLIAVAIPIYVGGDHFKLLRFYQPFFPIFLLLFFNVGFWEEHVSISLKFRPVYNYLVLIPVVPFMYFFTATPLHTFRTNLSPIDWEFRLAELGRDDAEKMNLMFSRLNTLPSVGVSTAGGFAYAYKGSILDMMGLNNLKMAHATDVKIGVKNHAAFDKNTFFELQPDIFHAYTTLSSFVQSTQNNTLYQNLPDFAGSFPCKLYKNIFSEKQFGDMYKPVLIEDPQSKIVLKTYVKTSFIEKLKMNKYNVVEIFWTPPATDDKVIIATFNN
jgi:hypothetical protein